MNQIRLIKIGFIILLVMNIALLAAMLIGQRRHHRPAPLHMRNKIVTELGFDTAQENAFKKIMKAHHEKMMTIDHQLKGAMKLYFDGLSTENQHQDKLVTKIQNLETEKLKATYDHFSDIKSLCTDDQLKIFASVIEDALRPILGSGNKMRPPPKEFRR